MNYQNVCTLGFKNYLIFVIQTKLFISVHICNISAYSIPVNKWLHTGMDFPFGTFPGCVLGIFRTPPPFESST